MVTGHSIIPPVDSSQYTLTHSTNIIWKRACFSSLLCHQFTVGKSANSIISDAYSWQSKRNNKWTQTELRNFPNYRKHVWACAVALFTITFRSQYPLGLHFSKKLSVSIPAAPEGVAKLFAGAQSWDALLKKTVWTACALLVMSVSVNPESDSRKALSRELENLRSRIQEGKLVLFIGEQASVLSARESSKPILSVEDWWQVVNSGSEVKTCFFLLSRVCG